MIQFPSMPKLPIALLIVCSTLLPRVAVATEDFVIIVGGENVGHLVADTDGSRTQIDFDYKNNGRGPTIAETIVTDELAGRGRGRSPARRRSAARSTSASSGPATRHAGTIQQAPARQRSTSPRSTSPKVRALGPLAFMRASCSRIRIERPKRSRAAR